jgi:dTMP kinase
MKGVFVTFEGIDGAGKSTHIAWAADFLRSSGVPLILTREPGGTELGEKLRELLLESTRHIAPETEALLMFAARRQHIEDVIRPALDRGQYVICDRFTDATFAYQGGGNGIPASKLRLLEEWVHPGLQPDLTLLFDVSAEVGRARVARIKSPDRFEREDAEFFARVRNAYLERARTAASRICVIDGGKSIPEIQGELKEKLLSLWKR